VWRPGKTEIVRGGTVQPGWDPGKTYTSPLVMQLNLQRQGVSGWRVFWGGDAHLQDITNHGKHSFDSRRATGVERPWGENYTGEAVSLLAKQRMKDQLRRSDLRELECITPIGSYLKILILSFSPFDRGGSSGVLYLPKRCGHAWIGRSWTRPAQWVGA